MMVREEFILSQIDPSRNNSGGLDECYARKSLERALQGNTLPGLKRVGYLIEGSVLKICFILESAVDGHYYDPLDIAVTEVMADMSEVEVDYQVVSTEPDFADRFTWVNLPVTDKKSGG